MKDEEFKYDPDINKAMVYIYPLEGAYKVEDDNTLSYFGFNQKTVDSHFAQEGKPSKKVDNLNQEDRYRIFEKQFVNVNGINKLPKKFQPYLWEFSFNSGPNNAVQIFQEVIGARADGIIGPKTLDALDKYIEKYGYQGFVEALSDRRILYIDRGVEAGKIPEKDRNGLINRVNKVREIFPQVFGDIK